MTHLIGQQVVHLDLPLAFQRHPSCSLKGVLEFAILVYAVFLGGGKYISLYFWSGGKKLAPLWVVLKCELVASAWYIATHTRISILVPSAAQIGVLFVDDKVQVGNLLRKAASCNDPGNSC